MEDIQVLNALQEIIEKLDNAKEVISYFSKPVQEGRLIELPNGRFDICGNEISCGFPIEVYWDDERCWMAGRVEYKNGYYFYNYDMGHPKLYQGMRCRIRG